MIIILIGVSFIFALLQTTFFYGMRFFSGYADILLVTSLILFFLGYKRFSIFFLFCSLVFFSIFSGVPFFSFSFGYFILMLILLFLNYKRIFPVATTFSSFIYFFFSAIVVSFFRVLISFSWSLSNFISIFSSAIQTAVIGVLLFTLARKVYEIFYPYDPKKRIKIISNRTKISF